MQFVLEIAKINLKVNVRNSILAAAALCAFVPVFVGTANLDGKSAALPLEMFVSLIGIVLLTPVFAPEQNEEVHDLVSSKFVDITMVYLIRVIYSIMLTVGMIGLFGAYMESRNCDVSLPLLLGTAADAVFLGAMGMFVSALCKNTVIGYMMPILYYALNIGMGSRMGNFYLFSMTIGEYGAKLWLFLTGMLLTGASLLYQKISGNLN